MGEYTGIKSGERIKAVDMNTALSTIHEIADAALLPAGIIFPYAGAFAPSGWALCNGDPVSRTAYPKLFAAISTAWGAGNGSTTFNLPDLCGAHIRGAGTSSGFTDNVTISLAGRINDAIRNITGNLCGVDGVTKCAYPWGFAPGQNGAFYVGQELSIYNKYGGEYGVASGNTANFDVSRVVPTAPENRVKARGVNFIIKLW